MCIRDRIGTWPKVTVQLPIYNERYVIERLIEAVSQFDYPRELLEIQVLDDSTDQTCQVARDCVERYRALGMPICYIHRDNREGYKAGALQEDVYKRQISSFDSRRDIEVNLKVSRQKKQ